jgi:hypothetical protein
MKQLFSHFFFLAYLALNVLCGSPIFFGANWLLERLHQGHNFKLLYLILAGIFLVLSLGVLAISWTMASLYVDNDISFFKCFKLGWMGVWVSLSSLPVVKHWLGHGDETVPRPDDPDDSKRE